jgi:putative membrane protein
VEAAFQVEAQVEAGKNIVNIGRYSFDADFISNLVSSYEENTTAEIVPMVVGASDRYPAAYLRIGILIFSLIIGLNTIFEIVLYMGALHVIGAILLSFLIAAPLQNISFIKRAFISKDEKDEEVRQRAIEEFFGRDLHHTTHRGGVLLFVSLLEHRIEILCDQAIKEKVEQSTWDDVIKGMIPFMKQGELHKALDNGVQSVGELLSMHLPSDGSDSSDDGELSNAIIVED